MYTAIIAACALLTGVIVTGLFNRWNENRRHHWDVERVDAQFQRDKEREQERYQWESDKDKERYQRERDSDQLRWNREKKQRDDDRRLETYTTFIVVAMDYASPHAIKPENSPEWIRMINLLYLIDIIATRPVYLAAATLHQAACNVQDALRASDQSGNENPIERFLTARSNLIDAVRHERVEDEGHFNPPIFAPTSTIH